MPGPKKGFKYGKGNLPKVGRRPSGGTNINTRRQLDELERPGSPPVTAKPPKRGPTRPSTGSK